MNEFKRGAVHLCRLYGAGSVQRGLRPVVIVSNDIGNLHSPVLTVVPITSKFKKPLPVHVYVPASEGVLRYNSIILTEQILTVNKEDISPFPIGCLPDHIISYLDKALSISLGLQIFGEEKINDCRNG